MTSAGHRDCRPTWTPAKFDLGRNIALSPGAVVVRDERFELIQYQATSSEVHEVPLLIVPPMINRFYIFDLAPGRSISSISSREATGCSRSRGAIPTSATATGISTPTRQRCLTHWMPSRRSRASSASRSSATAPEGCCARLWRPTSRTSASRTGWRLSLGVCVIDNERSNVVNAFATDRSAKLATLASSRKGYLDGRDLASVFLWLRPNDLIWPYVVNDWLLGKDPPAFDILYWNADTTRLPAALHREFITIATETR